MTDGEKNPAAGFKLGRLPVITPEKRAIAEPLWHDLSVPEEEIARRAECSVTALHNAFGARTVAPASKGSG